VTGAIVGALVLAGCGGSSHKSTSATSSSAAIPPPPTSPPGTVPANAPPAVRAVAGRMLVAGDIRGLAPQGMRILGITPETWVMEEQMPPSEQAKEVQRLKSLGFVRAVRERLITAGETGPEGLSIVVQFHSPNGARADVVREVTMGEAHGAKPFPTPAIPGAKGFGGVNGVTTGYNVAFAVGPYYYLVGVGYPSGIPNAPTRQDLINGAHRLYTRVRG